MITKKLPFLVISSSPYMRGILKFVLETLLHTDVTELESEEKALSFLKNLETAPSMIVYDYTANAYLLEDFVGYLRANQKLVRVIILVNEVRKEGIELLRDLDQIKLMNESSLPGGLVNEAINLFGGTPHENEEQYSRIDINFLSILDGINKNLYVKIGADKFIKISHEDDDTNIIDIKKYKSKGIDYLYLTRETALWVINQIEGQINMVVTEGQEIYDPESGAMIGMSQGEVKGTLEVVDFFEPNGAICVLHSGGSVTEGDFVQLY
jgi:hypothetical protein